MTPGGPLIYPWGQAASACETVLSGTGLATKSRCQNRVEKLLFAFPDWYTSCIVEGRTCAKSKGAPILEIKVRRKHNLRPSGRYTTQATIPGPGAKVDATQAFSHRKIVGRLSLREDPLVRGVEQAAKVSRTPDMSTSRTRR